MQKCALCSNVFEVYGNRRPTVRCPRCGKIQSVVQTSARSLPRRDLPKALPSRFLAAKARARCRDCGTTFEHEKGLEEGLPCPRCGSGKTARLMGRIFVVPDGAEESLHPRVRKWLRLLRQQNEWVTTFERHVGALESDLRRIGMGEAEVREWAEVLGRLRTKVEEARDGKLAEFERYVGGLRRS